MDPAVLRVVRVLRMAGEPAARYRGGGPAPAAVLRRRPAPPGATVGVEALLRIAADVLDASEDAVFARARERSGVPRDSSPIPGSLPCGTLESIRPFPDDVGTEAMLARLAFI